MNFEVFCESSWQIDRCLPKEITASKIPLFFLKFYDLKKEFKKLHKVTADLIQILEFYQIKDGLLFSSLDYCIAMSKIVSKMISLGHSFYKPETSIITNQTTILKV